jgi:translation initiation factor 2B subunit (eIF-2B alpha/beta/delta family)
MDAAVRRAINSLKKDRTHGAVQLTVQAIGILGKTAAVSKAATNASLNKEIKAVSAALLMARPSMVSIANYVLHFNDEFSRNAHNAGTIAAYKKQCSSIVRNLVKHCEKAAESAAQRAATLINNRSILLTCSYSSSVNNTLKLARLNGLEFRVLAAESRSGSISYGRITARHLKKASMAVQTFPDDQVGWHMARCDMVLLGTDAISQQGWMINGTPSLEICLWAKKRKMPVYVVCETAKIDVRGILATMREPVEGFDIVPLDLVTAFITDSGTYKPDDIYNLKSADLFGNSNA